MWESTQATQHSLRSLWIGTPEPLNRQTIANMENAGTRRSPVAAEQNANVLYSESQPPVAEGNWLERKLRPEKVSARYPIKGKALLFATCGFGSLGDALFGYNSGKFPVLRSSQGYS